MLSLGCLKSWYMWGFTNVCVSVCVCVCVFVCVCFFRTVSTLHALVVGLFCLYILRFDDAINEDPVW